MILSYCLNLDYYLTVKLLNAQPTHFALLKHIFTRLQLLIFYQAWTADKSDCTVMECNIEAMNEGGKKCVFFLFRKGYFQNVCAVQKMVVL